MNVVYTLDRFDKEGMPYPTLSDVEQANNLKSLDQLDRDGLISAYRKLAASYYAIARHYKEVRHGISV